MTTLSSSVDWLMAAMTFYMHVSIVVQQQFHNFCMSIISSSMQRCDTVISTGCIHVSIVLNNNSFTTSVCPL